ncbi:hypothetical protein Shyhy01_06790 [Streptomyces hygroscopicus subsp. hygroscopicus]|nr:hypothetical protein Shyhy01_06790 [Streptomyces hygroscopicus subsp. hygroscopicus]
MFLTAGYDDDYWPSRAAALSAYLRGDPEPLVALASPRAGSAAAAENGAAVYTAVECNDAPWPRDWAVWDRDDTRLARVAPFETWDNAWMNLPCAYWPAPRQRPQDVRTAPGALPAGADPRGRAGRGGAVPGGPGDEPAAGRLAAGDRAGREHARYRVAAPTAA